MSFTELINACSNGDLAAFDSILATLTVSECFDMHYSLVKEAVSWSRYLFVDHLLKSGINVNADDRNGKTALHIACENKSYSIIKLLLSHGANINVKSTELGTPLAIAFNGNDNRCVKLLLQYGAMVDLNDSCISLHAACAQEDCDILEVLYRHGADVNKRNDKGKTALQVACQRYSISVVKSLILHGADVNSVTTVTSTTRDTGADEDQDDDTSIYRGNEDSDDEDDDNDEEADHSINPLNMALQWKRMGIVDVLLTHGANLDQSLLLACRWNKLPVIRKLLDLGADVNTVNSEGKSPLYIAAENNRLPLVKLLIARGADVNTATRHGKTALYIATQNEYRTVFDELLSHGANITLTTKHGSTVLSAAAYNYNEYLTSKLLSSDFKNKNQVFTTQQISAALVTDPGVECSEILIYHGADVNITRYDGSTPLYRACEAEVHELVELLLINGANINGSGQHHSGVPSPLHIACRVNAIDCAKLLIHLGAEVNTIFDGITPLMECLSRGNLVLVKLLLSAGADVRLGGTEITAWDIALLKDNTEAMELISNTAMETDE